MQLKGNHRTCGTLLLVDCLSECQLVRAHLLDLLTGSTRDQFWCEMRAAMERSAYTRRLSGLRKYM